MPPRALGADILRPTPRDIDVAQASSPQLIRDVAADLGLSEHEYDEHGRFMAKVSCDLRVLRREAIRVTR